MKIYRPKYCECECGEETKWNRRYGRWNRFISGHNTKTKKSRSAMSLRTRGKASWNKGLTKETDQRVLKYSQKGGKARKGKPGRTISEEEKQIIGKANSIKMTALWQDEEYRDRQRKSHEGKIQTKESNEKKSRANKISIKKLWDNMSDEKKSARIMKTLQSNCICPNRKEKILFAILENLYPGEWEYALNINFMLNGKCPDFVNVNGQKKIIELFGDYWHRNDNPQDRIDVFTPFGYDTLVIWEHELKDLKGLRRKIFNFVELVGRNG